MGNRRPLTDHTGGHNGCRRPTVHTAVGTCRPAVGLHTRDNTNYYFVDAVTGSGSTTYNFWKAPIAGGNAVQIGSLNAATGTTYSIVDSDGISLLVQASGATGSTIYALSRDGSVESNPYPDRAVHQRWSQRSTTDRGAICHPSWEPGHRARWWFKAQRYHHRQPSPVRYPAPNCWQPWRRLSVFGSVSDLSGVTTTSTLGGAQIQLLLHQLAHALHRLHLPLCGGGTLHG